MKIIVSQFVSLDGVAQAPGGAEEDTEGGFAHGGWSMPFFDPEVMGASVSEVMADCEALLFGRRTWRVMADAWPGRAGDPFADQMNSIKKYVASRTLTPSDIDWNNTELLPADDAIGAIRELKASGSGSLQMMGSLSLTRELIANDLVDDFYFMVEPILLGGGKSPYPSDGSARSLELVDVKQANTGVLICHYRPAP